MIELQKVSVKHRHGALAVHNLSFTVRKGEVFCILGGTESGKTSLLKAIAGLYATTEGKILFDGKEEDLQRRDVCLLHEDGGFFPHRTVRYNLEYPLKLRGKTLDESALKFVSHDCLRKRIGKLTEEEKIAVATERLGLRTAKHYLLDNPLKRIETERRKEFFSAYFPFYRTLAEKGAVVYATDSVEEAMAFRGNICFLRYGVPQQIGTAEEMYRTPNSYRVFETFHPNGRAEEKILCEDENGIFVWDTEQIYYAKENLLNEIYIGEKVLFARDEEKTFLFDLRSEQRIYFE